MELSVIGQGAIGLLWYAHLTNAKLQPRLLCSKRAKLKTSSMAFTSFEQHTYTVPLNIIDQQQLLKADVILFCLKAYDILPAIKQYLPYINEKATIILCHNGMIAKEQIHSLLPQHTVLTLLTTHGSKKTNNFAITHTGKGQSQLGPLQDISNTRSKHITTLLNQALPNVIWQSNIAYHQWLKLAINCVINPITALKNIDNGELIKPEYQMLIRSISDEVIQVAAAEHIQLDSQQLINNVVNVAMSTAKNCSSMRADFQQKKTTEIEHINGFIVNLAEKHQLNVPHNLSLFQQISQAF